MPPETNQNRVTYHLPSKTGLAGERSLILPAIPFIVVCRAACDTCGTDSSKVFAPLSTLLVAA
ncbi:CRISPR-associated protein Cas5 [Candidatus Falkowbacteria bacterium]|nr:CRISPR-associated protein Cas5 [Candidatus Falkowbacteria bacterium]